MTANEQGRQRSEGNMVQIPMEEDILASRLKEKCIQGTELNVRDLLCDTDPNIEFQKSRPIHWAAESGNVQALTELLRDPRTVVTHKRKDNMRTALHVAANKGNHEVMKLLLDTNKIDINATDKQGKTALHIVAEIPVEEDGTELRVLRCLALLMSKPELEINKPDLYGRAAISRALRKSHKKRVLAFLERRNEYKLNVDYCLVDGGMTVRENIMEKYPEFEPLMPSPLMEDTNSLEPNIKLLGALQNDSFDEFNRLLNKHKDLCNTKYEKPYYCTCLELTCIIEGREKFVETLVNYGAEVNSINYVSGIPLLFVAVERLNAPALEVLIKKGININTPGINNGTVLHWLALNKRCEFDVCPQLDKCVSLLLSTDSNKINIDAKDSKGDTALHVAVRWDNLNLALTLLAYGASTNIWNEKKQTPLHVAALNGNKNAVLILFKYGANMHDQRDDRGTPLYMAAQQRQSEVVLLLLKLGSSFMCEKRVEQSLQYIHPQTLESYFDDCITSNMKNPKDKNYTLRFKYSSLPAMNQGCGDEHNSQLEMKVLLKMSEIPEHRSLLRHPLISTILFLKWQHACKIFYINIALFTLFLIFLTLYVIYNSILYPDNETTNPLSVLLWIFLLILAGREVVEIINTKGEYFRNLGNIIDAVIIVSTVVVCCYTFDDYVTQHAAAIAILAAWIEFLFLIGRLPSISVKLEMLKKVSFTFLKFGLCYLPLIIAFALSFKILFRGQHRKNEDFNSSGAWNTTSNGILFIFETLVMFTGEFAAKDLPFPNSQVTSHLVFCLFMFLIALAMFNLLNGLAVSDTQNIIDDAETLSLIARAKLVLHTEAMVLHYEKNRFLSRFLGKFAFFFRDLPNKMLYIFPNMDCKVSFKPYGDRKATMDESIIKRAIDIVNKKESKGETDSPGTTESIDNFEQSLEQVLDYKVGLFSVSKSIESKLIEMKENLRKLNDDQVRLKRVVDRFELIQKDILDVLLTMSAKS